MDRDAGHFNRRRCEPSSRNGGCEPSSIDSEYYNVEPWCCIHPLLSLIAVTRAPPLPIILGHDIAAHHHSHLALPQHLPQLRVARVHELDGLQLGLVPYPRVAARIEQDLDNRRPRGPLSGGQRVGVAHRLVQGEVALDAVRELNLEALLVEQDVEDLVCGGQR